MSKKGKIINDPVHGFIEIPHGILLDLIDTDLFQRDVSRLLAADLRGGYFVAKQLLRSFPVYFNEIGAEGDALDKLIHASPREKQKLIRACAKTIAADGEVSRGEGELMRAVSDSLGVPMPPLLPGQKLV